MANKNENIYSLTLLNGAFNDNTKEVKAVSVEVTDSGIFGTDADGDITFAAPKGSLLILKSKGEDNG